MDKPLIDKVAVVTGSSTGIGKAIAQLLAQNGASIALVGRNTNLLNKVNTSIQKIGSRSEIFITDLCNNEAIEDTAKRIMERFNGVDIIVNAAGVWHDEAGALSSLRLDQIPVDQLNEVLDVNIRAPMILTAQLLPSMIQKKHGKIVNLSGTFSEGGSKWLHYFTSKKAVESFTRGLSDELREFNIQVNCISPSDVKSEAYMKFYKPEDVKLALDPKDVAELALFLVSPSSDNISGQVIVIKNRKDFSPLLG